MRDIGTMWGRGGCKVLSDVLGNQCTFIRVFIVSRERQTCFAKPTPLTSSTSFNSGIKQNKNKKEKKKKT